jgi:site-specific recombinase XerD
VKSRPIGAEAHGQRALTALRTSLVYDLTMASRAYRGTRNLRAVQVLLGHSSIATTERYLAVDDSEIRAAMVDAIAGGTL